MSVPFGGFYPSSQNPGDNSGFGLGLDFALGDVRGLRLWVPTEKDGQIVLKSIFRQTYWHPGQTMDATCANILNEETAKRTRFRRPECRETHHHPTDDPYRNDNDLCARSHTWPGMDPSHTCGFYAYTAIENNPYLRTSHGIHVEGVIQGFGRTVIGTKGFRCSKARIIALKLPHSIHPAYENLSDAQKAISDVVDDELRRLWGDHVPIYPSVEQMLADFPLTHPSIYAPQEPTND